MSTSQYPYSVTRGSYGSVSRALNAEELERSGYMVSGRPRQGGPSTDAELNFFHRTFFSAEELVILKKRPVMKNLYLFTIFLIILGCTGLAIAGTVLWVNDETREADIPDKSLAFMLAFSAVPMGVLFYMLLKRTAFNILELMFVQLGFFSYLVYTAMKLNGAVQATKPPPVPPPKT